MKDMTQGKPWKVIMAFAIPMILSGIIQQFYSLADSIIVGNFASSCGSGISGTDALAAVGASASISQLFVMLGSGAGMGCGVVISQLFGAKKIGELKSSVYTALVAFGVLSVILAFIGAIVSAPITAALNTPAEIFDYAVDYLAIYMYGLPFLFVYNICNAIFNSLGDSKKSMYFLIFSSVLNIVLDYIFVRYLGWAVKGVAWATFIAQGIAGILSFVVLVHKIRNIKTEEKVKVYDNHLLVRMLRIGIPSMVQMSIVSIGTLLVQAIVNGFGSDFLAGYTSAVRISGFTMVAIHTTGAALSTFSAQNIGAGNYERPVEGIKSCLLFLLVYAAAMVAVMFLFADDLVGFFVDAPDARVLEAGATYLKITSCGFIMFAAFNIFNGLSRGAGYMSAFMTATLVDLVVRVVCSYALVGVLGETVVAWSVLVGWIMGFIVAVCFYRTGRWKHASAM